MPASEQQQLNALATHLRQQRAQLLTAWRGVVERDPERAALMRETAHDLRGSVGVIANMGAALAHDQVENTRRDQFYRLLQQHIYSMSAQLTELMDLARLEAGQEALQIQAFDASARLRQICDGLRPLALQRHLFLRDDGPPTLAVQGDPIKLHRIVQNLVLNALKATEQGGVIVRWFLHIDSGAQQWSVCIQDTGPGLHTAAARPLRAALKEATEESCTGDAAAGLSREPAKVAPPPLLPSQSEHPSMEPPSGEGIGLTIVKRLCELLGASVELNTAPGTGTTIQINFPLHYTR